jgi:hypothetical protein
MAAMDSLDNERAYSFHIACVSRTSVFNLPYRTVSRYRRTRN